MKHNTLKLHDFQNYSDVSTMSNYFVSQIESMFSDNELTHQFR